VDFFRKHFTNILMGGLVLVALAMILPYFFGQGSSDNLPQQIITPEEIKEYEPPFEHEGNLSFYKEDGTLIKTFEIEIIQAFSSFFK